MVKRALALALVAAAFLGTVDAAPKKGPRINADRELRTRRNECERDVCLGERHEAHLSLPGAPCEGQAATGKLGGCPSACANELITMALSPWAVSRLDERGKNDLCISLHFTSVLRGGVRQGRGMPC